MKPSFTFRKRLTPERDWLIMITVAALLLAVSIGSNLWFFEQVSQGGVLGTAPQKTNPVFSQNALDAIEKVFVTRDAEKQKYLLGTYHFVDPSK